MLGLIKEFCASGFRPFIKNLLLNFSLDPQNISAVHLADLPALSTMCYLSVVCSDVLWLHGHNFHKGSEMGGAVG